MAARVVVPRVMKRSRHAGAQVNSYISDEISLVFVSMEGARVINYSRNQEPAKLSHLPRAPIRRAGSRLPRRGALRGRGSAHPGDVGPQRGCGVQARAGTQAGKCRGEGRCHVGRVRRVPGNGLEEAWPKVGARKMGPAEGRSDLGTLKH